MIAMQLVHSLTLLTLHLLSSVAGPQQSGSQESKGPESQAVVSLADIVLDQYPVQNVDPTQLYNLALQLVQRKYVVKEQGTAQVNLSLLGRTIVIYDTKEQVQRAREFLARLDVPRKQNEGAADWKMVEYKPRFISLDTVGTALEETISHYSLVRERGLVILQDHAEDVDA